MTFHRNLILSALAVGLAAASPAAAQTAPTPKAAVAAGTAVKDTSGGAVGTIARVEGDHVIVKTDKHEVRLPAASFTPVADGLLFGMTQAQLNAEVDKVKSAADAKLAAGAAVTGAAGADVGTIQAVDAEYVTLKLSSGGLVRVPRRAFAGTDKGVVTSLTADELEAAAKGAGAEPAAQ